MRRPAVITIDVLLHVELGAKDKATRSTADISTQKVVRANFCTRLYSIFCNQRFFESVRVSLDRVPRYHLGSSVLLWQSQAMATERAALFDAPDSAVNEYHAPSHRACRSCVAFVLAMASQRRRLWSAPPRSRSFAHPCLCRTDWAA